MFLKEKNKLGKFMLHFYAVDCDLASEKTQEAVIEEVENYIPVKRQKTLINNLDCQIYRKISSEKNRSCSKFFETQKQSKQGKNKQNQE